MNESDIKFHSKFLSLVLRHKPEIIGLNLSKNGWANVFELLDCLERHGHNINFDELKDIVEKNDKKRFAFNEDNLLIRASQGHSIADIDLQLAEQKPPEILYHGTSSLFLESIRKNGLTPQSRNHVHFSILLATAYTVAMRHTRYNGSPIVLDINTEQMYKDGFVFFLSANGVWLTKEVPPKYLSDALITAVQRKKNEI